MNEDIAAGYDVLVWRDDDGDIVCCGYTAQGQKFLRTIHKRYRNGDILQIVSHPDVFTRNIPNNVLVGRYTSDTKRVIPLVGPHLQ